jgi:hypothetical protein
VAGEVAHTQTQSYISLYRLLIKIWHQHVYIVAGELYLALYIDSVYVNLGIEKKKKKLFFFYFFLGEKE